MIMRFLIPAATILGIGLCAASPALAQSAAVEAALEAGTVGEQADGYLGFARPPSKELKAEVDAINIKRRQGYTQMAQAKNVPIEAFAVSIGCHTLSTLKPGRAYNVGGTWAIKGPGPVALPAQCGAR
jgi:uncharacterized protein YdbL (DUF1318 family)